MVLARWKPTLAVACVVASCLLQGVALAEDAPMCDLTVSVDDAAKGLDVVTDPRCASGGEGCIDTVCRHCKATDTAEFPTYPSCADFADMDAAGDTSDDGSGESSGNSDDVHDDRDNGSGSGSMGAMPDNLTAESPVSGAAYGCPFPTSGGDFEVGIQLVGDPTCSRGGLGCFADVCRFCKFRDSGASKHLVACTDLGYQIRVPVVVPVLPPVNPDTGCPYNVSSGDLAVGVQLVGDASCAGGGLGCFKDVCRFCKFQETPQSTGWMSCAQFGYPRTPAPTFAPVSIDDDGGEWDGSTGCAYAVSPGDLTVGVQLVGDASCASGGLGCFGETCRFCQFRPTPQSKHMLSCASLGWPRQPTEPIGTPQDISLLPDAITGCPFPVSEGDFAAGVQLVGDKECAKGGLGCFKDVCRFCKFRDTPQSKGWLPCADYDYPPMAPPVVQPADITEPAVDYGTGCPYPVTSGDYAVGVQLVGDATCDKGGLGCYKEVCRYCKFQETPQSKGWVSCETLGWPRTVAPVARPVDIVDVDPATECPYPVSNGDYAAGIQLVGDATCVKGGLGCYKNVCRFCQFQETPHSKHFVTCGDLGYPRNGASFTPASVDVNAETGCPYPVSSGDYDAGIQLVGDVSCSSGGTGCFQDVCRFCKFRNSPQSSAYINCEDLGYFFGTDAGAIVPEPPRTGPSTKCPFTASPGDQAAGILLVGDEACDKGGIGCFQNVCRFCQFVPTEKSNQFVTCASLGYDYALPPMPTVPAPTPAPAPTTTEPPTLAPTLAPTLGPAIAEPTAVSTAPPCPFKVSDGDFAVGIDLVGDPTCAQGGIGCFENVCRYCKFQETPQAANWLPCANFILPVAAPAEIVEPTAPPDTTTPPTTAPPPTVPAPTPAPVVAQVCDRAVAQGDKDAGVGLATDYSCLIAGIGCIKDTMCRFCKVFQSEKSSHLEPCSVYGGVSTVTAQTPAAVDSTGCAATLSPGDTLGGVGAVYDPSCSTAAGVGCFAGGVCRYCQVFASDKSKDFAPCPAPHVAPVYAATKKLSTAFAATVEHLDELFQDKTFRVSVMAAACVGVVAALALVAIGAKRVIARRSSNLDASDDEAGDESEQEEASTKVAAEVAAVPGIQEDQV